MNVHTRMVSLRQAVIGGALLIVPSLLAAQEGMQSADSQKTFYACYVPGTGTVYRIKEPGLPAQCGKTGQTQHIEFSWTDGAEPVPGPEGPMGPQGEKGDKGDKGDPGAGGVSEHGLLSGLSADDHLQYLLTEGVRQSINGFAVTGTAGLGSIPASGAGARLMWYPGKAAFRAGWVTGNEWDDGNVGGNSVALGFGATARGINSFAVNQATASGEGSIALGATAEASGNAAVALGAAATALGPNSFAASWGTARGTGATAFWNGEAIADHAMAWLGRASNQYSLALGLGTEATGSRSVAIGWGAKASGNMAMSFGRQAEASGPSSTAIGTNVTTGGYNGSFIYGDASTPTAAANSRANQFAVRAQHFWLGTSNTVSNTGGRFLETSTGAYLTNGGTWTNSSDVNRKHNFARVIGEDVLARLAALPISTWSYRSEEATVRHMGPTAQDFRAAFGLGDTDRAISTVDADGVALAAIQALAARTTALQQENQSLRDELARMRQDLADLVATLAGTKER